MLKYCKSRVCASARMRKEDWNRLIIGAISDLWRWIMIDPEKVRRQFNNNKSFAWPSYHINFIRCNKHRNGRNLLESHTLFSVGLFRSGVQFIWFVLRENRCLSSFQVACGFFLTKRKLRETQLWSWFHKTKDRSPRFFHKLDLYYVRMVQALCFKLLFISMQHLPFLHESVTRLIPDFTYALK